MSNPTDERARWARYLAETPTYGTYFDRRQEYAKVYERLLAMGLQDGDLIVDVGAGPCDFDRYLRQDARWNGRYWPIDGAVQGVDFERVAPAGYLPTGSVDWIVAIETIEHVPAAMMIVPHLLGRASSGVVVSTPNGEILDVASLDPTHVDSYDTARLVALGLEVEGVTFSPDRAQPDTLIGWTWWQS